MWSSAHGRTDGQPTSPGYRHFNGLSDQLASKLQKLQAAVVLKLQATDGAWRAWRAWQA